MLNYLWAIMIITGVIYGILSGNITQVADGAIDCNTVYYNAWCDVTMDRAYADSLQIRFD
jgi:hypothetical protein